MRICGRGFRRLSAVIVLYLVAGASAALAQVAAGEITGIVKDQAGAAVPGATVTVTDVNTNRRRTIMSSGEGVFTAPSLAPGEYRVDVEFMTCKETSIKPLVEQLSFIKSKIHWGVVFRFGQLKVPASDFALIAQAMGCSAFAENAL